MNRRPRRGPGWEQQSHDAAHQSSQPSPSRSVKSVRPGPGPRKRRPRLGSRVRREMRPNHSANNPLFQRPRTRASRGFRTRAFARGRRASRFMALDSLPIVRVCEVCRPFRPTLHENRLSSDAPSGSLPAGPHEQSGVRTIQSAFRRRAAPTNREPCADFCNQREGRAHPRAARSPARRRVERLRRPSKAAGGGAPVTRLGVELPLHRSPRPDQASAVKRERPARIEAGTLVGRRGGRKPGAASAHHVPRGPPYGLPRER